MTRLRVGVIGLGLMGRNHARVLQQMEDVDFIGAADPQGDKHRSLLKGTLFGSVDELIAAGVDAVAVSVPTADHEEIGLRLVEAGVHALIEKPVASTYRSACRLAEAFRAKSLVGAVGHIERFNPALLEVKRRLDAAALGRIFAISTERVGPFPGRIKDVGVVKDLATHDLDLVRWLTNSEFKELAGFTTSRMGRDNEDLLVASGLLTNDAVINIQVNWVTPTKRRVVTILGERGAFVADMLASDLTYYANAAVPAEWDSMARLRGVSEGDVIRYALRKPEPLATELDNFKRAVLGDTQATFVSLEEGAEVVRIAETLLEGRSK